MSLKSRLKKYREDKLKSMTEKQRENERLYYRGLEIKKQEFYRLKEKPDKTAEEKAILSAMGFELWGFFYYSMHG